MFVVSEIRGDLEEVLETCDTTIIFRRLNAALDLLQPMLPTDSNIGLMDICTQNCVLTLPNEVETPLAINVAGHPADFRNKWYEHHLNGVGSTCCGEICSFGWENQGLFPTFRDLIKPSYLFAFSEQDEGNSKSLIVYGIDENDKPLYSCQGTEEQKPGLLVPIIYGVFGVALTDGMPKVKKIFGVSKPSTNSFVRFVAMDSGRPDQGTLVGYYRPDELAPAYRRVKVSGTCNPTNGCSTNFNSDDCCDPSKEASTWVRMRYQRRQASIISYNDLVMVPSKEAVLQAVEAVNQYRIDASDEGDKFLAKARGFLEEKQASLEGPNFFNAQYPNDGTYGGGGLGNMI